MSLACGLPKMPSLNPSSCQLYSLKSSGARKPFSGILLFGAPGCGKSFLAKAAAHEGKCAFISISSDIFSRYQGESAKAVADVFKAACEETWAMHHFSRRN